MLYRKRPGRVHKWHNHPLCAEWPDAEYVEHETTPAAKDICPECAAIERLETQPQNPSERWDSKIRC